MERAKSTKIKTHVEVGIYFYLTEKECKPLCTEISYEALVTYDHLNPTYVESVTKQLGYDLKQR